MKKVIAASVMAMALATGAAAEVKVGLGYTLLDSFASAGTGYNPANLRVPIDFDFGLRIEPELGFGSSTANNGGVDLTDTTRTLAVGGYYNLWAVEDVNFYAGGRLALINFERELAGGGTANTDNTSLQGLFGAEYAITPVFTVAAQAGLEVIGGDDPTGYGTVGHVVLRYFFVGGSSSK